jgi:hypothetical protein
VELGVHAEEDDLGDLPVESTSTASVPFPARRRKREGLSAEAGGAMMEALKRSLAVAALVVAAALVPLGSAGTRNAGDLRAAVALVKKKGYVPETSTWDRSFKLNVLIGVTGDGHNQWAFFFYGRRYLGTDTRVPSAGILQVWRDDRMIALLYILYRPRDPLCCPTGGGAIVRFRWTGSRIVALDRIPPKNGSLHR